MSGHRQAEYVVRLLDREDQEIRVLDGVEAGSVQLSASTRLRASGSLTIRDTGESIDWLTQRVRIDYVPVGIEGWSIGVFCFASPRALYSDDGLSWEVELLGKLTLLDRVRTESTLTIPAGANLVEQARLLIVAEGETRIAATPSSAMARSAMTWDPGTSVLTIINDLLGAAGYWAVSADGVGVFRLAPYVRPAARPTALVFAEGEMSIHSPEWTRDQDIAAVPNRVVLVGQGSDDRPALVGVATNEDASSPYSFQARGGWVVHSETGVEAADQATIDALARRRLIDASTPTGTEEIRHMPVQITPNDLVRFTSQGLDVRALVSQMRIDLSPTALVQTTIREVIDL